MPARVVLRERPSRALAIVTSTHALIFQHSPGSVVTPFANAAANAQSPTGSGGGAGGGVASGTPSTPPQRCIVELSHIDKIDLGDYRNVNSSVHGTLGLITTDNDVFLCVVSNSVKVASVRPGETVQRIVTADFRTFSASAWILRFSLPRSG